MRLCLSNLAVPVLLVAALTAAYSIAFAEELPEKQPIYPLWDCFEPVSDYAKKVNLPPTKTLDLGNGVKLELVLIPAGKFIMGTPEPVQPTETVAVGRGILGLSAACVLGMLAVVLFRAIRKRERPKFSLRFLLLLALMASVAVYGGVWWQKAEQARKEYQATKSRYDTAGKEEKPAHPVTITMPFYMGKFVVTQEQYLQIMGTNPCLIRGKDNPVEQVWSCDDALEFCKKLKEKINEAVRLPTEAEWEYSCRAGSNTTYFSGDTEKDLDRVAWYFNNSKMKAHPVGQKEANGFGLYDMHGNAWQWCQDWYSEDYYAHSPVEDPEGPHIQGSGHVLRGGSWIAGSWNCRVAFRFRDGPVHQLFGMSFRVVVPASRTP